MNSLQKPSFTDSVKKAISIFTRLFKRNKQNHNQEQATIVKHEEQAVLRLSGKRIPTLKQLKYGWRVFTIHEQRIITTLLILFAIMTVITVGTLSYNRTALLPAVGGTYSEGLLQTPQFLNPILAFNNSTDVDINRLVFSGLLKYDKNLELQPDLAESFSVSDDNKIYTFVLKDNIKWHDGESLTADDVIFTIKTIQNPQFNSPHFGKFRDVKIEKIDDKTIKFTLKENFAGFLSSLTLGIVPEHIWGNITPANSRLAEANIKPIGSGPYKFSKIQKETDGRIVSYTLESFDQYYDKLPYIKTVQFKFYANITEALDALQKQNIDGIKFLPFGSKIELSQMKTLNYHTLSIPQYTALFFNQSTNDKLATKAVREALAYAINKEQLVNDIFNNEATVIDGPLLPDSVGYYPEIKKYNYDTTTAAKLLEDAGWLNMENEQYRKKENEILEINLTTVDIADTVKVAEKVKEYWENIGIKVNLDIVSRNTIERDVITPRNYQVLLFGEVLGAEQDPFPFWHSSKRQSPGVNLTNFANKQADSLLEKARLTNNEEDRAKLYKEFQDILIDAMPAIFLYTPHYIYPVHTKIKGIEQTKINTPADRFNDISNWYIKTERRWK